MHRALPVTIFLIGTVALAANDRDTTTHPGDDSGANTRNAAVTYIDAAHVAAAFAKGAPLLEVESYKIHASRREAPGLAEIHALDTDIIYVLDGTATLVTGGTVRAGDATAPGEIRGSSIEGGETRQLVQGDVLVVPNGTPHWFKEVSAPFLYYVVKVTAPAATPAASSAAPSLPAPTAVKS